MEEIWRSKDLLNRDLSEQNLPFLWRGQGGGSLLQASGGGSLGECGRESYVRQGERGRNRGNFATIINITQSEGTGAGNARYGRREIWTPCPLSSSVYKPQSKLVNTI